MLVDVVDRLRCPHCAARTGDDVGLALDGRTLGCPAGHSFDVAKQGYVSLLTGQAPTVPGDTGAMVAAREAFLAGGHFADLTAALATHAAQFAADSPSAPEERTDLLSGADGGTRGAAGCVVDLGAGTGHHLAGVLDAVPGWVGVAADISGYALRRAARAHPRAGAVRCDAWRPLPLRTGAADVVLIVFAPRNGAELHRVLRPGGVVVVAAPTDRHLRELATAVGAVSVDPRKTDRLDAALGPYLTATGAQTHETTLRLSHAEAVTAVAMGPAAWHVDPATLEARVATLAEPVEVTVSVTLSVYRRTA
ncbi:putative RNA methyltransferase [Cryptosporangium minutisporangium]|uniref:rRNA (Guanine-N1)-methyltransferase n=1 Tax=Cryptosporangium minutisporangium TaxID=113569 RepID=A0ABP6TA13_9ACTN